MSEIRENLKPMLNKRVNVRGMFAKWEDHWIRNHRQVGRVCIAQPEIDGAVVCRYVWVVDVPHWREYRQVVGAQVRFDAVVLRYTTRGNETTNGLGNAGDLTLLVPPALAIPELSQEGQIGVAPESRPLPASQPSAIERIRLVAAWAKSAGGYEAVENMLKAMPSMPVPELLEYIRAIKE